jgi:predicted RNase H-like nuclease (RuvC/YqgF family)
MTNEEKAARLEGMAAKKDFAAEHAKSAVFGGGTWVAEFTADAFILREAAQLMREREERSLLTSPDWKTMYEAQERDLAALRKELEALKAERDAAMAEIERLREHEARARWSEETKAQVSWSITNQTWRVLWYSEAYELRQTSHADRNDAIDAARGAK